MSARHGLALARPPPRVGAVQNGAVSRAPISGSKRMCWSQSFRLPSGRTPYGKTLAWNDRSASCAAASGDPTRDVFEVPKFLNNTPHSREIRKTFYQDVTDSIQRAVDDGVTRMTVETVFPEMNTEQDVYRVGTMLELVRTTATQLAQDGKRVRICVQGSMGEGVFQGLPLSLSGVRRILELMDWEEGLRDTFIFFGSLGREEVQPEDDIYLVISPQPIVGYAILPYLQEHCEAAQHRPVVLVNPNLIEIQSSGGVMSVRGRKERYEWIDKFQKIYHFTLLYKKPAWHPIYGALRMEYGGPWEVYKRVTLSRNRPRDEEYQFKATFDARPNPEKITKAIFSDD